MASASDYLEDKILDHCLGTAAFTMPTVYVALFEASPGDDNSGSANEISGGGYARQEVEFSAAAGGVATNANDETFTNIVGYSATNITHVAIYDAAVAGNLLFHGPMTTAKPVPEGEDAVIKAGQLLVTAD